MASVAGKPEKSASSRLLTMKFMQRSTAASSQSAPSTPGARPAKRQRMSDVSMQRDADAEAVQVALAAEELKRTQALERHAVEAGDTKWTLNLTDASSNTETTPLKVVSAGYIAIDSPLAQERDISVGDEDEGTVRPRLIGRRSFGKFNRVFERQQNPDKSISSSESSDNEESSEDEAEDEDGTSHRPKTSERAEELRAQRKARRKEEKAEASQLADKRRSKGVKLNNLNSISSGGGNTRSTAQTGRPDERCFNCNQAGHKRRDCPRASDSRLGRQR